MNKITCNTCLEQKEPSEFHTAGVVKGKQYYRKRCKTCTTVYNSALYHKNKPQEQERNRRFKLKSLYDMTLEEYAAIYDAQGGVCAVCALPSDSKNMAVDHDHNCCPNKESCGKCIRGLLCQSCNNGLGRFRDNPETLRKAADYLDNFQLVSNQPAQSV